MRTTARRSGLRNSSFNEARACVPGMRSTLGAIETPWFCMLQRGPGVCARDEGLRARRDSGRFVASTRPGRCARDEVSAGPLTAATIKVLQRGPGVCARDEKARRMLSSAWSRLQRGPGVCPGMRDLVIARALCSPSASTRPGRCARDEVGEWFSASHGKGLSFNEARACVPGMRVNSPEIPFAVLSMLQRGPGMCARDEDRRLFQRSGIEDASTRPGRVCPG